jgi:hypothetical protein
VTWDIEPELRALAALCKELHLAGVGSEMRDSLPAVAVRTSMPGVYVYVFISTNGQRYVWHSSVMEHPVSDAAGAAQQLKTFMRETGRL